MRRLTLLLLFALPLSCMAETKAPEAGPGLAVTVAPLGLVGVGEVVWDVEVLDGEGQVVWQRRLTSSRYGARGGLSYVGPCNAQAPDHTVRLWVAGLFEAPVAEVGEFGGGADLAGSLEYVDPTRAGPIVQSATCVPNGDTPVRFDVAVMRPANQGFFDVAVTFEDIFCSAKFDCCDDSDEDGVCAVDGAEDHLLLFDGDGQRASTMVLGFACTAGVGEGATELYLDPLWLDCTTGEGAFSVDIAVAPGGAPGNQCEVGVDGMSACAIVTGYGQADADDSLYQVGVYRGVEALESGGQSANKVYWNVALGVKRPTIASCVLRTRGTAARQDGVGMAGGGVIAPGAVYPVIAWDVDLGACTNEALGFGEGAPVRVAYAGASSGAFSYGFSGVAGARTFCTSPCVCAGEALPDGTTCDDGLPCTSGDVCSDGVCAGVQACTAAPGECWEANGACDGGGVCAYSARASGVGCADDGNPCTIDRCDGNGLCEHVAGNVGATCRAAVGECDLEELCDGGSECPADAKVAVGVECRGAVDGCDVAEVCVGGDECPAPSVSYCGECGAADGVSVLTAPTEGLCAVGAASVVSGDGPWSWTCAGQDGADASCLADASCPAATLSFGDCAATVAEGENGFEEQLTNENEGHVGVADARCDQGEWLLSGDWCAPIVDGVCGAADGGDTAVAPSSGLCASGVASSVSGSGPWMWTCAGAFGGADASCTSYKTCAGTSLSWSNCSATTTTATRSQTQSLTNGVGGYQGSATATCSGTGDGPWALSSTVCNATVNGSCGSANGVGVTSAPTTNLCSSGSPTSVTGSSPYTWSCNGSFGGSTANCSSNRGCDATTLSWGAACAASRSAQAHGFSASLTSSTGCYGGSATSTCSQGTWSVSGATCTYTCGGGGGGGCFLGSTLILLADGTLKPLEKVQVGDMLQGKTQVNIVTANSAYVVKSPLYRINDSGTAYVTGTHPFYTTDGWKAFDPVGAMTAHWGVLVTQLELGDILLDMEGNEVVLEYFEAEDHGESVVYNPSLDGDHTYFANGYLMHNQQKQ